MKINITVTEEDIRNGKPGFRCYCPLAIAVKRSVPGCHRVEVDALIVAVDADDKEMHCWMAPYLALQFIRRFDRGMPVKPITLTFTEDDKF